METTENIHGEMAQNRAWSGRGTLQQLVAELERQKESKLDFVVDTRQLLVEAQDGGVGLKLSPRTPQAQEWMPSAGLPIMTQAIEQIGQRLQPKVPTRFTKDLAEVNAFRAGQLLSGLMHDGPRDRFVRCLDGRVRAYLSSSYRILDNYDFAFAALEVARECNGEVLEASISDRAMRIKFTSREIWDAIDEPRGGDKASWYAGGLGDQSYLSKVSAKTHGDLPGGFGTVHPLVTISNSETGHGGLGVRFGIVRAVCFNLATVEDVVRRVHLGSRVEEGIFSEEACAADSQAIFLKARDAIRGAFHPSRFRTLIERCRMAQCKEIGEPREAVAQLAKDNSIGEQKAGEILEYFLRAGNQTQYGLGQAVARVAQTEDGADDADALETLAGSLVVA